MADSEELAVLKDVTRRLNQAKISYMVTGSIVVPEDLILSKLFWAKDSGSESQLLDVRNLLKTVKKLNRPYLARWAKRLGIGSLYKKVAK